MILTRSKNEYTICTKCNPIYQSKMELDLLNRIKEFYFGDIEVGNKTILDGKEIDIYLSDIELGIEFNGIYWHSDNEKEVMYHYNKKKLALEKGIDIIFIWEDDWVNNMESVLETISIIIDVKINDISLDISGDCLSDLYIRNFGKISEWMNPKLFIRNGFNTYDSGLIKLL